MIVLLSASAGAILGGVMAKRREGNRLDIAQYSVVLAIVGGLVGMILTVVVERLLT
jgi:hypothetical protein